MSNGGAPFYASSATIPEGGSRPPSGMANREEEAEEDKAIYGESAEDVRCEIRQDAFCDCDSDSDSGGSGDCVLCKDRVEVIIKELYGTGDDNAYDLICYCCCCCSCIDMVVCVFAPKACNSLYAAIIVASDTSRAAELAWFVGDKTWTYLLVSD